MGVVKGDKAVFKFDNVLMTRVKSTNAKYDMEMEEEAYLGVEGVTETPVSDSASFDFEYDYDDADATHQALITPPFYDKHTIEFYPNGLLGVGAWSQEVYIQSAQLSMNAKQKHTVSMTCSKAGPRVPIA